MIQDLDMMKRVYDNMAARLRTARDTLNRPLTLTEKILYSHVAPAKDTLKNETVQNFGRGKSYVDFYPDRVAMQDATAQMALCNSCPPAFQRLPCPRQFIATT